MKKVMLSAALGLALSACGGDSLSWRDPDSVRLTFGTPSSTLTLDEQAAADGGAAALGDATAFVGEADDATSESQGMNVANLPNQMQAAFGDDYETPVLRTLQQEERAITAQALALVAPAPIIADPVWDNPGCWTVTAYQVTYARCRRTQTQDGTTMTLTLNGSISRETGLVSWDVTLGLTMTEEGVNVSTTDRLHGSVTFSTANQTIVGSSRSDIYISMSAMGMSADGAVTYSADYDLQYATDPAFCVTGGTLTAKRFWSRLPQGADPAVDTQFTDTGLQFTWSGCGSVQVAWPVQ